MKRLRWILPVVAIIVLMVLLCSIKYRLDWESDFSEYSSGLFREQAYYVSQPVSNMINEEQMPLGQSETEEMLYYFTMVKTGDSEYRVYAYDKDKQETELVYETPATDEHEVLAGVSSNGRKLLLRYNNRIVLVDLFTQSGKVLFENINDYIAVYGQELLYLDKEGLVYSYNLKTGHTECIDGIKTFRFALYEGKIYYADEDNHGYVSIYDIDTGKIERTDEEVVFGFFIGEDGIKVK